MALVIMDFCSGWLPFTLMSAQWWFPILQKETMEFV